MFLLPAAFCLGSTGTEFTCTSILTDVSVDTLYVDKTEYHLISVEGFSLPADGVHSAGLPAIPRTASTFLLPPNTRIDSIEILTTSWDLLPGKYYLYPTQPGLLAETTFTPPDFNIYNSDNPFPLQPVHVSRQGSAMGYSVVSLAGTPVRYIPSDSTVFILTSITLDIRTGLSESEQIIPNRETLWSASLREQGILSMVANPQDVSCYQQPATISFADRTSSLNITQSPSPEGDGVDMVIITNDELAGVFDLFADYRTQQGIITVVRTTEWIDQFYSGCDTPERIRNFLRDAHLEWGIQAVILGGDDDVVPVRECNGWTYTPAPFPSYQLPSDDYYADIDGNWSYDGSNWRTESTGGYLDLCLGRWPVNTVDDVNLIFNKIQLYEQPEVFPENFARELLLIGSNNPAGNGANDMMDLVSQLEYSLATPEYLNAPATLYFPHSLPGGDLCRNTALDEFDQGYGMIIHADHSEIHKLATAGNGTLGQYMWDSDFSTMNNAGQPSILWTLGCETGHFDGACCFSEAGLLTSAGTGLIAVIANARGGMHAQKITAYAFCDALFNTSWIIDQHHSKPLHWPLNFLGEAYRCSKNMTDLSFIHLNLLGSPLMYVWRDDPEELSVSVPPLLLREGLPADITATVTDGTAPVENATVCLWKKDEIFRLLETDAQGQVTFADVCIVDGSGDQDLVITAVKRIRQITSTETTTASYIPDQITLDVLPANVPLVSLECFAADPDGDGTANPGETVDIYLTAANSGGETAYNITVELSLISGGEYIDLILDSQAGFPDINPDHTGNSSDPLSIVLNPNVPDYAAIEFKLLFSYSSSSGILHRESPLFLTVYSENYALTLMEPSSDNSSGRTAEIILNSMLLANCGSGEGENLEITVNNLSPPEPFQVNMLTLPSIESNRVAELNGQINLTVFPQSSRSNWLEPGFPGCAFDVLVSSEGGDFIARNADVEQIDYLQNLELTPPVDLQAYEVGRDYINLIWEHYGDVEAEGFYIYYDDGVAKHRVYPLPVPVKQVTIDGLIAGREFDIEVTAVDHIGRESEPAFISVSTTCPVVDGWPIQLEGSPGGGPAIADMDNDGNDEIVVATSFGMVYIIEKDGTFQTLYPPADFDFDRFLGCAVGDVDGDSQLEIIVSCQRKIEVLDQEQATILLFNRPGMFWNASVIASTNVNEEVSSPSIAGTPVLFQADSGITMEIALRTRGNNGGNPHLYVWRYDTESEAWVNFNSDFPLLLSGGFFNSPSAVDFDGDGLEELIVTVFGSDGSGTALLIADFQSNGDAVITEHGLPELDTESELARAFCTLAAAEENGTCYIAGVAKNDAMSSSVKKVFVYSLESEPLIDVSLVWQTEWLCGYDSFGNMPGPAIGNSDSDPDLEVIYCLNGGIYNAEGYIASWDLNDGTEDFLSDTIPFNPILGGGGASIKSQPVTGLTTFSGSDRMVIFSGFSSLLCGHNPHNGPSMIEGFPSFTRDGALGAPAVCDLDGNGIAEVLYIDYSGFATLFDWQQGSYTSEGWHMYQDNPLRNGFYNTGDRSANLDIRISGKPSVSTSSSIHNRNLSIRAEIEITGSGNARENTTPETVFPEILQADNTGDLRIPQRANNSAVPLIEIGRCSSSITSATLPLRRTVTIAAFSGNILIGSTVITLEDGIHAVEIPLRFRTYQEGVITIVADPWNEHQEADEANNTAAAEATLIQGSASLISIPTPAESIELTFQLPAPLPNGIKVTVYSTDGRVVINHDTQELQSGTTDLLLNSGTNNRLPAGMYTVCIEGLDSGKVTRKVIILN
ncbi:MAG: T9SS type A sorting domain-containing protein [Candidatus Sabulitectum sp.]|nr:T9SS type A sorting domain-containing protein [Candidatus Sabulitectum sp.]